MSGTTTTRDPRTDGELLDDIGAGDRGALHELFLRHEPWLAARVRQRCADPGIVDEVVQDTFLAVWRNPSAYRGAGEVAAWVWGIAIRTLLHHVRPRRNLLARLARLRDADAESAEEAVLARVEHSDVGQALERLSPERQRVALAAALVGDPRLLVLDEPATGLDPEQLDLRRLLLDAAPGGTAVLSTHSTAEVTALCRHVLVLMRGQVAYTGTPAGLAALADGRVWLDDAEDLRAVRSWATAEGAYRHVGDPPAGAGVVPPTLEDGYLLLARRAAG